MVQFLPALCRDSHELNICCAEHIPGALSGFVLKSSFTVWTQNKQEKKYGFLLHVVRGKNGTGLT